MGTRNAGERLTHPAPRVPSITTECVTRITSDDEKMCTMEA